MSRLPGTVAVTKRHEVASFLVKANENLSSAASEFVNARYNACANRAYYACFHAAIAALRAADVIPPTSNWGHAFVQSRFAGQLINRAKLYSPGLRDTLPRLASLREKADYEYNSVSEIEASRALRRADTFVGAVSRHLAGNEPV